MPTRATINGPGMSSIDDALRRAIAGRRLLQLTYHDRVRVVEPHDYGVLKARTRVLVYQLRASGAAGPKGITGWRLLDVDKIDECVVLDETFPGSRGLEHRQHQSWDVLYARVE